MSRIRASTWEPMATGNASPEGTEEEMAEIHGCLIIQCTGNEPKHLRGNQRPGARRTVLLRREEQSLSTSSMQTRRDVDTGC